MKTLEEFNQERRQEWLNANSSFTHANGIECPECEGELWDSSPGMVLASDPPQLNVHCPACGYRGYRIA